LPNGYTKHQLPTFGAIVGDFKFLPEQNISLNKKDSFGKKHEGYCQ